MSDAYAALKKRFNRLYQINHLVSMAHWDSAVMMPDGGNDARSGALAEASVLMHELITAPEVGEWIGLVEQNVNSLSSWDRANLREMKRRWQNETSVTSELVQAKSLAGSRCEHAWRHLRAENNWSEFKPLLQQVVDIGREEAQQRAAITGVEPYDALMDLYEPGLSQEIVDPVFEQLKNFLPDFIQAVIEKQKDHVVYQPAGKYPVAIQKQLSEKLMQQVGFDFVHGRLDTSHHPFCGGVAEDVRITTRYNEADFTESLMGVLHETGHAKYELGLPREWAGQPVGEARGMAIHESQSLFQEMQVARSYAFLSYAAPIMNEFLGQYDTQSHFWEPMNLYHLNTQVSPGFIRVNADEVTYPLHVILRYEIERDMIAGKLQVEDLPDIWDQKMRQYLGLSTIDNYRDGCMQDIHWTDGSFGYFPTYTIGAMIAAQLFAAARRDIVDLDEQIMNGRFESLNEWQKKAIWSQGSFYTMTELIEHATGHTFDAKFFIQHLQTRYMDN